MGTRDESRSELPALNSPPAWMRPGTPLRPWRPWRWNIWVGSTWPKA